MWYVINKTNGIKLKKFERKIIIPLFSQMIKYKSESKITSFMEYLETISDETEKAMLKYICKRTRKGIHFIDLVDSILVNLSEQEIRKYYYLYLKQNEELKKRSSFIEEVTVPEEFKQIFVNFFYEHFFGMDGIWEKIDGTVYTREIFHENFKRDNKISVCPYCDIDTMVNAGNAQVEHFWPKSSYPFLAMSALNLISSCHSCNQPFEGKGVTTYNPITMPYYEQIGDKINFSYDILHSKIQIKSKENHICKYIELLKLEKRYATSSVYNKVEACAESIYTSIQQYEYIHGVKMSEEEIKDYVKNKPIRIARQDNLYFATVDVFSDYNEYLRYKGE